MPIHIKHGNVLDSNETWLLQQCNCVTRTAKGLAASLFHRFPHADVYSNRHTPLQPGQILFRGEEQKRERLVANMMAQYFPGKASNRKTPHQQTDSADQRIAWFIQCLLHLAQHADDHGHLERSLAVPFGIGCGLAGGQWQTYASLLTKFAEKFGFIIVVYKFH